MRLAFPACVALQIVLATLPLSADVAVTAENTIPAGWMPGGWGSYAITVRNDGAEPVTWESWTGTWMLGDETLSEPWTEPVGRPVAGQGEARHDTVSYLPEDLWRRADPEPLTLRGVVRVIAEGEAVERDFSLAIVGATLPEPTRLVAGAHVGLELMESRFERSSGIDRAVAWMNASYVAMADLTGLRPYEGQTVIFKECPEHPYWAYAGNPVVLNTRFVESTLADFDKGVLSFGWVHELGHDFDVLGDWYIWNGPMAECQANFKLCYAAETIDDPDLRLPWSFQAPGYPSPDATLTVPGLEFTSKFFVPFGDRYLADPARTWNEMESDDLNSFLMRIQRVYGWEVYKGWYRTYGRLAAAGRTPPEAAEDKVALMCAILSEEAGVDLLPLFQRWRFPTTTEDVARVREAYGLGAPSEA